MDSQQQLQKLLNDKEINWYGLKLHTNQKPVPVLKKKTDLWWETAAERESVIAVLEQWPNQKEFGMLLYRLQGHYWQQDMSEALAKLVVEDYLRLLGKYPPALMALVIDEILLDPTVLHMPKIGQLAERAEQVAGKLKYKLRQLDSLMQRAID